MQQATSPLFYHATADYLYFTDPLLEYSGAGTNLKEDGTRPERSTRKKISFCRARPLFWLYKYY